MQTESLDTIDPLEQLRPIVLPTHDVSWWPLAPGWWVLMAVLLLIVIIAWCLKPGFVTRQTFRKRWQYTQTLLENLYIECSAKGESPVALQHYLQQSSEIFKRTVRHLADNPSIASLTGEKWINFLKSIPLATTDHYEHLYGNQLYARRCEQNINLEDLHRWACAWLKAFKKHHKKYAGETEAIENA